MPEPFKNVFNSRLVAIMASHFQRQWPKFDAQAFTLLASHDLQTLELKARSQQIVRAMCAYLPDNFQITAELLLNTLSPVLESGQFPDQSDEQGLSGWVIMPLADYVGLYGQGHFELSMRLFKALTRRFSAEFGIRFFLLQMPEQTLAVLKQWCHDPDHHVRRLVSEGVRPRLPWAMQLPLFMRDPAPVLALLEHLKDDEALYVRRSVANNLNDIGKDNPTAMLDVVEAWITGVSKERLQLIRHACRSLIKKGDQRTLRLLGYRPLKLAQFELTLQTPEVILGEALIFSIVIRSKVLLEQPLIIDYRLHHLKANGKTTPKVFKWRTTTLAGNKTLQLTKKCDLLDLEKSKLNG